MGAMMWIEVHPRHGEAGSRQRIEADEARIGRAFDNDVVVDDPHVAPHHVRIFRGEDGMLVAEDLATLNGLFAEHGGARVTQLSLAKDAGIRIGRTVIRIHGRATARRTGAPAGGAARPCEMGNRVGRVPRCIARGPRMAELTSEPNTNRILLPVLGLATVLAVWSGGWSMVSRIFSGQARFALQLRIVLTACIALIVWDQMSEALSFSFAWRAISDYAGLGAWVLLAVTCWAHLRSINPRHMRVAMGLVVALVCAGAALQFLGRSEQQKLVGQRATLGDLRPPGFRLAPLASTDDFFQKVAFTKSKVDLARAKDPGSGILGDDND